MELIFEPDKDAIEQAFARFGSEAAHHPGSFLAHRGVLAKPVFVSCLDGSALFAIAHKDRWEILGDPLSAETQQMALTYDLVSHLLRHELSKKVTLSSAHRDRWADLAEHCTTFRLGPVLGHEHTSVFSLSTWDPHGTARLRALGKSVEGLRAVPATNQRLKELILAQHPQEYSWAFNVIDHSLASLKVRVIGKEHAESFIAYWERRGVVYAVLSGRSSTVKEEEALYDLLVYLKAAGVKTAHIAGDHDALMPASLIKKEKFSLLALN